MKYKDLSISGYYANKEIVHKLPSSIYDTFEDITSTIDYYPIKIGAIPTYIRNIGNCMDMS
jgi:hypothetical protein